MCVSTYTWVSMSSPMVKFLEYELVPYRPLPSPTCVKLATMATVVPELQNFVGLKSTRRSLNQCHAPSTGVDVVIVMCCSMSLRAEAFTALENTIEIGIATPTVVRSSGAMLSIAIGGPDGRGVGVGDVALGAANDGEAVEEEGEADEESVGTVEARDEAVWAHPDSTSISPIPMPLIRPRARREWFI